MSYKIQEIEGIGPINGNKLTEAGINTTSDLLEVCGSAKGRKDTSGKTGISESVLLGWTNKADLMRIKGIGKQYSELLEAAGVDTVKELKMRVPDNLSAKMREINEAKKLTRSVPEPSQIAKWVEEAKEMEPIITH